MAYSEFHKKAHLYYWHHEARNSNAEVDFITSKDSQIVLIEVKSTKKGNMKSLHMFLDCHQNLVYGLKISEGSFAKNQSLTEIPLYAIEGWLK